MKAIVEKLNTAKAQVTAPGAPFELVERELGGNTYRVFKNAPENVMHLINQGRQFGDKTFLVYQGQRWSFNEFFRHADALASQLAGRYGVQKGDRVAIAMRNRPEWMAAFVAIVSLGAIAVPLNSWSQREELVQNLANAEPKVLFCDPERLAHVTGDLDGLDIQAVVTDASVAEGGRISHYDKLCVDALTPPPVDIGGDDPVMIMYTSGTTSGAKGVLSNHRAFCQALMNIDFVSAITAMASPQRIQAMMASGFEPAALLSVPLFHVSGLQALFLGALKAGRKIVIMYKWDVDQAIDLIEQERLTQLNGSPAMMQQLFASPRFDQADMSSIAAVGFGGSATPQVLLDTTLRKFPNSLPGTGYGLTETNSTASSFTAEAFAYKPRSSGIISPIVEIHAEDDLGNVLPKGSTGELCVRGVTVMMGYWRNPTATEAALRDGWFHSGDIGYVDEEDFVFIVDRIKDIVNRGGEKISTLEVESCIHHLPGVAEVAAFAVPDAEMGEVLAVAIVPEAGVSLDAEAVRQHVAAHLAGFKVPKHVSVRNETLPRNASGKVMKQVLKAEIIGGS
ncbi:AMP-binding protein [Denitratisoma sp. DHT3]|uniref:class I adenylate-forming enzyme family protein n=1 Tax=Denitratisoma sp. DHT3 TaxID=1981880 RepID=UPI001198415F|nr:class I adenylate-forming enzyme family protein [Denitratisoma sp. DHT3]QDX80174.1 AMP-binding protein [Denitratisoma sp. DHT3]